MTGSTELPIDSSWLATYQDQGLVGDVLDGLVLITLLIVALISPRGPARAVALFLIVVLLGRIIHADRSWTTSADMLDLAVAMSLLMPPLLSTARSENPWALKPLV